MASIGQLKLPDNNNYNLSVPFVIGTGSTAGTWLGTLTGLTAYYDGLLILYKPSVAGASTTTLNLNSLGAKTCYINNTTKLTTHFPVHQPILLSYSESQNSGCWMCVNNYWANTNNAVTQTATSTNANYEVLFSSTADNTTRTEGARKNNNLTFNPSTGNLAATKLNGVTIGSSPKFTDTTYESKSAASGGTALSLVTTGEKYNWNNKMDKTNPSGSGTFSLGRKEGSNIGNYSVAIGFGSEARGDSSTAIGTGVIAKNAYQHVIGRFNIEDPGSSVPSTVGTYAEIVGNGMGSDASLRSNARTLDWDGNEVLAGRLKLNGTQDVPIIYEVTQSQYDIIKQSGKLIHNALYVITDAPNLNPTASDIEYSSGVTVKQKIDSKADTSNTYTKSESLYCPPSHDFANGTTSSNAILWFINTYGKKPMSFGFVIKGLGWFECFITFYSGTQGGGIMILNGTSRLWVVTYINGAITLTEKT